MDMSLNVDEMDAIGEIANISIGAATSYLGNYLDEDIDMSVPCLQEVNENLDASLKGRSIGFEFLFPSKDSGYCVFILKEDYDTFKHMLGDYTENDDMLRKVMLATFQRSQMPIEKMIGQPIAVSLAKDVSDEWRIDWKNDDDALIAVIFDFVIAEHIKAKSVSIMPERVVKSIANRFIENGIAAYNVKAV